MQRRTKFSKFLVSVLTILFINFSVGQAFAYSQLKTTYGNIANEFFFSNADGEVLIPIRLIGRRSGVYHMPVDSELSTLITVSGAIDTTERLKPIIVKRMSQDRQEVIKINWAKDVKDVVPEVILKPHDVVLIDYKPSILQSDFATYLQFYALIASSLVSTFVITNYITDSTRGSRR